MRNTKAKLDNWNRPTKDEFGNPLGRRHATFYEWFPIRKPLKMSDGEPVLDEYGLPRYRRVEYRYNDGRRGRLIPLSYAEGRRRCEGPRGGRGWQYFHFKLYVLDDGTICRFRHERVDRDERTGEFTYSDYWEPFTGYAYGIDGCKAGMHLVDGHDITTAAQSASDEVLAANDAASAAGRGVA